MRSPRLLTPVAAALLCGVFCGTLLAVLPQTVRAQTPVPTPPPSPTTDSSAVAAEAAVKQIDLGDQWFRAVCLECHAVGSVSNPDFRLKWGGRSAFDLYELIRSTMPEHEPGSLTQGTYTAIVAYLMKLNGMPVGTSAISSDSAALATSKLSFPAASSATSR
ncbi:MAG: cytochrome c [Gemmatimonadaceae bacterium]|nr:cytochrome c [Gemmatimonadaceae bacterium]